MHRVASAAFVVALAGACADPPVAPPTAGEASDTMQIRCDGATTDVLTPIVQARTDGVHLVLENTTDDELFMQTDTQGEGVPPGETSMGLPILPGSAPFRCLPVTDDLDTGVEGGWARFDVLAPGGWVSPDVDCPGAGYRGVVDYKEGARGVADPLQDAPKHFREDGEVVQAGYATDEERTFVLLRDGEPVAGLVYVSDGHGGWLRSESFGCSD